MHISHDLRLYSGNHATVSENQHIQQTEGLDFPLNFSKWSYLVGTIKSLFLKRLNTKVKSETQKSLIAGKKDRLEKISRNKNVIKIKNSFDDLNCKLYSTDRGLLR